MKIELVDNENYKILEKWWLGHNWPPVPRSMLPKIGFIVNDTVAGFIYTTDSEICIIEWIISDPESHKIKRKESLDFLLKLLCDTAKDLGFKACFTYAKNGGLMQSLEKIGYEKTDEQMTHFIKRFDICRL